MKPILAAATISMAVVGPWALAGEPKFAYVDLQPKANQKLSDTFHSGRKGHNLAKLGTGEQTLDGVKFKIGDKLVQLGSSLMKEGFPRKIEAIAVDRSFSRLYILHATGFGGYGKEGDPLFVADGTPIGEYKVHYADKSTETIPVVYGKDVRDWWNVDKSKEVSRGKLAWEGTNDYVKQFDLKIRIYRTTWENPHPAKRVTRIDYLAVGNTVCAPFCVALTTETK